MALGQSQDIAQNDRRNSSSDVSATFTTIAFDNGSLRWLESAPDCRPRRTYLHLPYSYASPFGLAIFVTHDPQRSKAGLKSRSAAVVCHAVMCYRYPGRTLCLGRSATTPH